MMFARMLFIQALWNYNRMMGYGFCYILAPVVRKYGGTSPAQFAFRYDRYFNTHPFMAPFVMGAVAGLEKKYSETGDEELLRDIENIKLKLMGPLAALGDSFFWGALKPFFIFCASFAVFLSIDLRFAAASLVFYLLLYNLIRAAIMIRGFDGGFNKGKELIEDLKRLNLQKKVDLLRRTAIILLGTFWGFGMISMFYLDLRSALPLFAASLVIMALVRRLPNIIIFYFVLIILLIGGII